MPDTTDSQPARDDALVAIVCPVAGAAPFLEETIRSVLAQSLAAWTLTLIDNGYAGDLAGFSRRDDRITVITEPRPGASAARNAALRGVTSAFVAFLDADDLWHPQKLALQCAELANQPDCGGVYTGFDLIDESGDYLGPGWNPTTITFRGLCRAEGIIAGSNLMVRTAALESIGMMSEDVPVGADVDFLFRLARSYPLARVEQVLLHYRVHPDNMTKDYLSAYRDMRVLLRRYSRDHKGRSRGEALADRRIGVRRIRRTYAAQAFDKWRASPRRGSPAALRHLTRSVMIDCRWVGGQVLGKLSQIARASPSGE